MSNTYVNLSCIISAKLCKVKLIMLRKFTRLKHAIFPKVTPKPIPKPRNHIKYTVSICYMYVDAIDAENLDGMQVSHKFDKSKY